MEIWDSVDPVAMQYVRGCSIVERTDPFIWHHCFDSIHTGKVNVTACPSSSKSDINLLSQFSFRLCNTGTVGTNPP